MDRTDAIVTSGHSPEQLKAGERRPHLTDTLRAPTAGRGSLESSRQENADSLSNYSFPSEEDSGPLQTGPVAQSSPNIVQEIAEASKDVLSSTPAPHSMTESFVMIEDTRSILIVGKTGNGKSTLGNILLGEKKFKVGRGMASTTVQTEECSIPERNSTLKVVDTPDLSNMDIGDAEQKQKVAEWKKTSEPGPNVILLAVRCDVRYTAEEYAIYQQIKELWGDDASFRQSLVVGFTFGDRQDTDLAKELETVCEELKSVLKDAGNRYVVFNNKASVEDKVLQKTNLMEKAMGGYVSSPGMLGYFLSCLPTALSNIHPMEWGYDILQPVFGVVLWIPRVAYQKLSDYLSGQAGSDPKLNTVDRDSQLADHV